MAKPKGLYANINSRKKLGTSRPKSKSTISPENYANMQAGFPKKDKMYGGKMKEDKMYGGKMKKMSKTSKTLVHYGQLSKKAQKKARTYWS